MTTGSNADNEAVADDTDDLAGLGAILQQLVAEGLGPAMGLGGDWRKRSAIERVARLGPEELNRRIEAIYKTWYKSLVGCAFDILRNRDDAEEVVDEAFRRVLQADPDLNQPDALKGYVWSAVQNVALVRGRRMTRDRAAREPHDPVSLDTRLASRDMPLADQVADKVTVVVLLHMLSPRQRQCIMLRYFDGLTVKETAARLGISEGNVKRTIHEVRARLAAALEAAA